MPRNIQACIELQYFDKITYGMNPTKDPVDTEPAAVAPDRHSSIPTLKHVSILRSKLVAVCIFALAVLALLAIILLNPFVAILIVCFGIAGYVYFTSGTLLKNFAKANGYSFLPIGFVEDQTGLLFTIGYGPEFRDIVFGHYQERPFFLFIYSYSTEDQEDSHRYARTVLSVNFDTELPAFVLRKHKLLQIFGEEGESLHAQGYTQKLDLEGDFNDYFQVFIRPDTQIEVLSVLTPDVMELVMNLDRYEVELTDDGKLYVYFHKVASRKQELENTYTIFEALVSKIQVYTTAKTVLAGEQIGAE